MSKAHSSLSPTTNIMLIFGWSAAALFLFVIQPHAPVMIAVVGAGLGAIGGVMQHMSFRQATKGFSSASSLLEVRSAFKATTWGAAYIRFLYFSKFVLIALAFVYVREPSLDLAFDYAAGYFSLMFLREVVTLRDVFFLRRLSADEPENEPTVA